LQEGVTLTNASPLAADLEHVLTHTTGLWEPLRGENIFVTGGTGFFGRWLLESFAHANSKLGLGARMVVLSRNPEAFAKKAPHLAANPAIRFVEGDVRTFMAAEVLSQLGTKGAAQFGFIIHAATVSIGDPKAEDSSYMISNIVEGTLSALEFALATNAKRFLLTSSGAVYGRQPFEMTHIPETYFNNFDLSLERSAYGKGKLAAEVLCGNYQQQHGLETVIARCFAFVGPFLPLDAHFAIGNFIRDALKGGPINVNGDGAPYRSYLYAADLVIWLWTILLQGKAGRAYNVGSEEAHSISDLAKIVAQVLHAPGVHVKEKPDPARSPARYVPSCHRAATELGLEQWIDLADAIKRAASLVPGH
jgi:nucleoside-diphosphate-sugar epimerase